MWKYDPASFWNQAPTPFTLHSKETQVFTVKQWIYNINSFKAGGGSIATIATIARSPVHPVKSIFWLAIRQLWRLMISVEESFAGLFLVWQQLSSLVPFDWLQDLEIFGGNRLIIHTVPQIHGSLWEKFFLSILKLVTNVFTVFCFRECSALGGLFQQVVNDMKVKQHLTFCVVLARYLHNGNPCDKGRKWIQYAVVRGGGRKGETIGVWQCKEAPGYLWWRCEASEN